MIFLNHETWLDYLRNQLGVKCGFGVEGDPTQKEAALRSLVARRGGSTDNVHLWVGTTFREHLERRGWTFDVLDTMPDPDTDGRSLAYHLKIRALPLFGAAL